MGVYSKGTIQIGYFLKGRRILVIQWLLLLFKRYRALKDSQIGTVTCLDGGLPEGDC